MGGGGLLTWGFGEDVANLVDLLLGEVSGSSVHVNLSNFACKGGKSSADSFNCAEGERNLMFSSDVGVHHTQKVLEIVGTGQDECIGWLLKITKLDHESQRETED